MNLGSIESFTAEDARQDRIKFKFGEWIIDGHQSSCEAFFLALSNSTWNNTDDHLFSRLQGADGRRWLKFISRTDRGAQRVGAPLVDGEIVCQRVVRPNGNGPDGAWARYKVFADVAVNPTRALAHQPVNSEVIDFERGRREAAPNYNVSTLATAGQREYLRNERPIDPMDDNVLIDRRWLMMARYPHWESFSRLYLHDTFALFAHLILDAANNCGDIHPIGLAHEIDGAPDAPQVGTIGFSHDYNLQQVETYWDIPAENPIATVYRWEPLLRSLGTEGRFRVYDNVVFDRVSTGNAPSISAKLVTGLWAKIYPKTTRKIRFELTHDFRQHSTLITSHKFTSLERMSNVIFEAATNAAEEANTLLQALQNVVDEDQEQYTPYELFNQIFSSTSDPQARQYLINSIIENGGYRHQTGMSSELSAANHLLNRNVLYRTRPRSLTYSLRAEYQLARRILAGGTN